MTVADGHQQASDSGERPAAQPTPAMAIVAFWLWVGLPLAWGVYCTLVQTVKLFR